MKNIIRDLSFRKVSLWLGGIFFMGFGLVIGWMWLRGSLYYPVSIDIGPISIRLYSLSVLAGLLVGVKLFQQFQKRSPELQNIDVWDAVLFLVVPTLIGARAYHVITDLHLYAEEPIKMLFIWNGGLGWIGAVIGGLVGLYFYTKRKNLLLEKILGVLVIILPGSQAIGRLGNFFNRELYGFPTDLPWGVYIAPEFNRFPQLTDQYFFHPLFLYEAIANLVLATVLYILWKRGVHATSLVIFYISGYGMIRFILDFLRIDGRAGFWIFSYAQWLVIMWLVFAVLFGMIFQIWYRWRVGEWFTKK